MIVIDGENPDQAWIAALSALLGHDATSGGKAHHVIVGFPSSGENVGVRKVVDEFLLNAAGRRPKAGLMSTETVSNTLFPEALYRPGHAEKPRDHLYEMHEAKMRFHRRRKGREKETYFSRITGTDGTSTRGPNQLEDLIVRMRNELSQPAPKSSAYEIGVSEVVGTLRVHTPGRDRSVMGFPCLSHVSATLVGGVVHLTAQYRNQHFIRKALGNYVGLSRLCYFIAAEVGAVAGDVLCVAAHADAEFGLGIGGKTRYQKLLDDCRAVVGSVATADVA